MSHPAEISDGGDGGGGTPPMSPTEMFRQSLLFLLMCWTVGWFIWE